MQNSMINQIKDLEEQRQKLIDEARDKAMEQANDAIATLKELGIHYQIVAKNGKRTRQTQRRKRAPADQKPATPETVETPTTNMSTIPNL